MSLQDLRKWMPCFFRAPTHPNTPQHTGMTTVCFFVSFPLYLCTCCQESGISNASPTRRIAGQIRGGLAYTPDSPNHLNNKIMAEELQQVADLITANTIFCTKEVLTSDEAARYLGISKSYLYKLTMKQVIPHYKPMGKMCYFNRVELESWLQSNRVATADEISQQAQTYCMRKGGKR